MRPTPCPAWWARPGVAVVSMPGQIDRANCAQVHAALMRAVQAGATAIIADLTRTAYCGDAAIETLVSVHARAAEAGARLRVAVPNTRLGGQIAGSGRRLDVYPDLTAAPAGPRSRGTAGRKTAAGYRLRSIVDPAARRSVGKLARRLLAVPRPARTRRPGCPEIRSR